MKFPIPRKQALFYFYSKVKLVIELYKKIEISKKPLETNYLIFAF
jgi:hypothetical protein